jgi:hypothetical protein
MPHTISLQCFNSDFSSSSSIDTSELENVVAQRKNLKLENEADRTTLTILKENNNEWWPLLWISADYAYINSRPIFDFGLYYDLVEIAESINASIVTQDGILLFIPKFGLLYDPDENEDLEIEIGELSDEIRKTDNIALAIKSISRKRKEENQKRQEENRKKQDKINRQYKIIAKIEAKQHYIAIAVIAIMILLLIIKRMTR